LLNTHLQETYHSIHGAIQESQHVFIKNGLQYYVQKNQSKELRILEVGLGTGLNALLTALDPLSEEVTKTYISVETDPLDAEIIQTLNYPYLIDNQNAKVVFAGLHAAEWNKAVQVTPNFTIHKIEGSIQKTPLANEVYDVVYFDAFAPGKQPEMWGMDVLSRVTLSIKQGGIIVTYCAKGQLKRDLKSLGFVVESLPGPPGKAQMIRAIKTARA